MKKIRVGIAYYNGSKYIDEQVESILNQKFDKKEYELELVIHDDTSKKEELEYIKSIESKYSNVKVIENPTNKGAALTFMDIMFDAKEQGVDYLFWSDQDDVWKESKVSKQITAMENEIGSTHLSIKTNFKDIEKSGKWCTQSYMGHQMAFNVKIFFEKIKLSREKFYGEIDPYIDMFKQKYHDYFIKACVLAVKEKFAHLDEGLVMHRIHGDSLTNALNYEFALMHNIGKYNAYLVYMKYLRFAIPAIIGKKFTINEFNKAQYYIDEKPSLGWMRWKYNNLLMRFRFQFLFTLPDRIGLKMDKKKYSGT